MTWLSEEDWQWVQRRMPIVAVDIAVLDDARPTKVGLIRRNTPHQGIRWNLVGGRVHRREALAAAIRRHVRETLGRNVRVRPRATEQPLYVAQYGPFRDPAFLRDPRRHVVGLTYALRIRGSPEPEGEALQFKWFDTTRLPPRAQWGFDQDRAAEECLRALGLSIGFRPSN